MHVVFTVLRAPPCAHFARVALHLVAVPPNLCLLLVCIERSFVWSTCDVNDDKIVKEVSILTLRHVPFVSVACGIFALLVPMVLAPSGLWHNQLANYPVTPVPHVITQVYQLLTLNYVEDDDEMFRCAACLMRRSAPL